MGEDFKDVEIMDHVCGDVTEKLHVPFCWTGTNLHPLELISPSHLKTITHSIRLALAVNQ